MSIYEDHPDFQAYLDARALSANYLAEIKRALIRYNATLTPMQEELVAWALTSGLLSFPGEMIQELALAARRGNLDLGTILDNHIELPGAASWE